MNDEQLFIVFESLTKREIECLRLARDGVSSTKIGEKLSVSRNVINETFRSLMARSGAPSRFDLAAKYARYEQGISAGPVRPESSEPSPVGSVGRSNDRYATTQTLDDPKLVEALVQYHMVHDDNAAVSNLSGLTKLFLVLAPALSVLLIIFAIMPLIASALKSATRF